MNRALASGIENVPQMAAYYDALLKTLKRIDISVVLVQLIDFAPPEALPFLAEQYDVLGYKGYALCETDDQRRALLKAAPSIHKILGTPASIENAIKAVGFANAIVTERTGIYYNGVYRHNGLKRHGGSKWYNISVQVFYTGDAPDGLRVELVTKLINKFKSTRSVLDSLVFTPFV